MGEGLLERRRGGLLLTLLGFGVASSQPTALLGYAGCKVAELTTLAHRGPNYPSRLARLVGLFAGHGGGIVSNNKQPANEHNNSNYDEPNH